MAEMSVEEIKAVLRREFGDTLSGPRDEGLDRMAAAVAAHEAWEREAAEAALAEMVEEGALRYVAEPVGGAGAGIIGVLTDPNPANLDPMEGGKPLHGAVPASQEHGSGYWDLSAG